MTCVGRPVARSSCDGWTEYRGPWHAVARYMGHGSMFLAALTKDEAFDDVHMFWVHDECIIENLTKGGYGTHLEEDIEHYALSKPLEGWPWSNVSTKNMHLLKYWSKEP